jgi:hypothetical protein
MTDTTKNTLSADMLSAFVDNLAESADYMMDDLSADYADNFDRDEKRQLRVIEAGFVKGYPVILMRRVQFDSFIDRDGNIATNHNWVLAEKRVNLNTGEVGKYARLHEGGIDRNGIAYLSQYGMRRSPNTDLIVKLATNAFTRSNERLLTVRANRAVFNAASVYAPTPSFNRLKLAPFAGIMAQFALDFPADK